MGQIVNRKNERRMRMKIEVEDCFLWYFNPRHVFFALCCSVHLLCFFAVSCLLCLLALYFLAYSHSVFYGMYVYVCVHVCMCVGTNGFLKYKYSPIIVENMTINIVAFSIKVSRFCMYD